MPKAQNFSWESTSTPSLCKALSKRPYFSFRGKQPAIDSLMLGNPTSCEDHLNRPNHLDRSAILEFGPPSPFFMAREVKFTLSFCIAVDFCWCFLKVFVAFHSENINFMHCNAQGGLIPVFRITKILQILLWVIRFWSQTKKGVETKKTGTVRLPAEQLATQLHVRASLMWVQGFMVWEDLDPFDKKELNHLATPVGKKNTHQNRRSQKYNH